MIGVTATAIDHGFRVVVVLAGGKDDLRQQTARRFNTQLLRQSDPLPGRPEERTMPRGLRPLGGFGLPMKDDAHQFDPLYLRALDALQRQEPVVLVIKKHVRALERCRGLLRAIAPSVGGVEALPTLVLDDECDDASVDTIGSDGLPIPTAIEQLWEPVLGQALPVAYVGYTATAAANLLQHPSNPLFPADFVMLLRTPGERDTPLQFQEADADRWYSGGETYYRAFGASPGEAANFLVAPLVTSADLAHHPTANASLRAAVRAYLIGAAYRLALDPGRDPRNATRLPAPHTMLVQTSAARAAHRFWADALRTLYGVDGPAASDPRAIPLNPEKVAADLQRDEGAWRQWYDAFRQARERVYAERPHAGVQRHAAWSMVRARLADVIAAARIRVVNSDEEIGATLDFAPGIASDGGALPPPDLYSIVVGGAKLSRGLTLEGLSVSYFTRWAETPTEDTILQLCRWYGYRGPHLEFCRLVTTEEIASELREMQENDVALRNQLADLMARGIPPRSAAVVLSCNARALPTAKRGVGVPRNVAFSPFDRVFRSLEVRELASVNEEAATRLVAEVRRRSPEVVRTAVGGERGIVSRNWTALEVVEWLEALQYSDHNPDQRGNAAHAFYREPDESRPTCSARRFTDDPYQVAAYLREWDRWAAAEAHRTKPPLFNVGVAHGALRDEVEPFDFPLLNREVTPAGQLQAEWTGGSAHWPGDIRFDFPQLTPLIHESGLRHAGAHGLLLLYVVHKAALGRYGEGRSRTHHSPTFGVVIPDGGPAFRRVIVDHRRPPAGAAADQLAPMAFPPVDEERAGTEVAISGTLPGTPT